MVHQVSHRVEGPNPTRRHTLMANSFHSFVVFTLVVDILTLFLDELPLLAVFPCDRLL
jgi:hypothetical protein